MKILLLLALAPSFCLAQEIDPKVNPGSLFQPSYSNPFADRTARQVGDLVTILVNEQTLATYGASTKTSKDDKNGIQVNLFNDFLNGLFRPITTSASGSSSGQGSTNYNSRMATRLGATVIEVLPNGNLVIEAKRTLVTNKQTQMLALSGIVRRDDITPENTVLSSQISEAEIRMEGKGSIADRQRKGILTQIIDWLF